jgi:hypothetical protein
VKNTNIALAVHLQKASLCHSRIKKSRILFKIPFSFIGKTSIMNTEINFDFFGTFFYRKKKALLPTAKASL